MIASKSDTKLFEQLDDLWLNANNAMREHNYNLAIDSLTLILRIDRKNATAHNRLGIVYAKMTKYRKSLHHFKKARKYENSASSEHNLGLIYYETEKYRHAKSHLEAALKMEPAFAARHIALAKVYEKLEKYNDTLQHLDKAMRLGPNEQTQQIYIDAYSLYGTNKRLSKELLEALKRNKMTWSYEILDSYPLLIDALQSLHLALEDLVYSHSDKNMSLRSKNTKNLVIAYLHNLKATIFLLDKNYSLASANVARSMFEIYLKIGYGMKQKTNRGFAELERTALINKHSANTRLLKRILATEPLHQQKVSMNKKLSTTIKSLNRRYANLQQSPSHREIALMLDAGIPGNNYFLYEHLYERGSDIIHAESSSISRSASLSGTRHAGLFVDSYELLKVLQELVISLGDQYCTLPELTQTSIKRYNKRVRDIQRSLKIYKSKQSTQVYSSSRKTVSQPRAVRT